MTYDIFFHDDFDGRASAAVMLHFLKQRKDRVERFVPVGYGVKPIWMKSDGLKKIAGKGKKHPVIIVDFLYHPAAAMWFDHHPTAFIKQAWEDRFKPSATHHFAPEYASACRLVIDALTEYYGYRAPRHIRDMATWLDICDGAQYRSARQTILLKEPALQIDAFIHAPQNKGKSLDWLIKLLADKGIAAAARDRRVKPAIQTLRAAQRRSLEYYRKHLVFKKQVACIDIGGLGELPLLRFAAYYLKPGTLYTVMRRPAGPHLHHFKVGVNPWKRERNHVHIGSLLMKHGGGGHKGVGAITIKGDKAADAFADYLVTLLNNAAA